MQAHRTPLADLGASSGQKEQHHPTFISDSRCAARLPGSPIPSSSPSKCDSSSLFAFSSSPPRNSHSALRGSSILPSSPPALLSSPIDQRTAESSETRPLAACISLGETLYIGRKLKSIQVSAGVKKMTLPKAAKHASRRHCQIWLEAEKGEEAQLVINVSGQNGMLLDGEKIAPGQKRMPLSGNKCPITLGFYSGIEVVLDTAETQEKAAPSYSVPDTLPTSEATLPLDLPSSPPSQLSRTSSPVNAVSARPTKRPKLSQSRRCSSVAAPSPYAHQDDDGFPPESSSEEEEDDMDSEAKKAELARLEEASLRVKAAIEELDLDLVGCIASNLVFQPRATLTTSECVALLLDNQQSLRDVGDEHAWRPSVLHCLRTGPFGRIDHNGLKDASGKKLETSWHYAPTMDSDATRRNSLSPFVKQVRSTQRERKQYFYKRPSDLSKRKRW